MLYSSNACLELDRPQGIGTTASHNEMEAEGGTFLILTEEELTYIHDDIYGSLDPSERQKLLNLLDSHRKLLSANAELKLAVDAIGMIVTAEIITGDQSKHLYTILGIVKMIAEGKDHE